MGKRLESSQPVKRSNFLVNQKFNARCSYGTAAVRKESRLLKILFSHKKKKRRKSHHLQQHDGP